jgi:REP-associated tyrosine transposase
MCGEELRFVNEAFDTNYIAPVGAMVDVLEKGFAEQTGFGYADRWTAGEIWSTLLTTFGLKPFSVIPQGAPSRDYVDYDELIRQGKAKKIFRAKRKVTVANVVSHVTQRAAGKEPLFLEDKDYLYMLANMKEITKKRSLEIYSFCLMPNHVHILISPREDKLDDAMRDLFSRYAMMFNRKYQRRGHLFAGPYRQSVCLDDSYLLAASLYIHVNPARAGIVTDPRRYRWSSVKLFHDQGAPRSFVNPDFVLRLLGREKGESKKVYSELLDRSVSLAEGDVLEKAEVVTQLRRALARVFPGLFSSVRKNKQIEQRTGLDLLDEEEIQETIKAMKARGNRISPETKKAWRFLIGQLIARGYKREDIAATFGVSVKTVYNTLKAGV